MVRILLAISYSRPLFLTLNSSILNSCMAFESTLSQHFFLQVRFARPETDRAKAHRLSSFRYLEKKQSEESWIDLNHYSIQVTDT